MARTLTSVASCPICSSSLVQITLGEELTLRSCSCCDNRWWQRAGQSAPLGEVLQVVAATDGKRVRSA